MRLVSIHAFSSAFFIDCKLKSDSFPPPPSSNNFPILSQSSLKRSSLTPLSIFNPAPTTSFLTSSVVRGKDRLRWFRRRIPCFHSRAPLLSPKNDTVIAASKSLGSRLSDRRPRRLSAHSAKETAEAVLLHYDTGASTPLLVSTAFFLCFLEDDVVMNSVAFSQQWSISMKNENKETHATIVTEFDLLMQTTKAGTHDSESSLREGTCLPLGGWSSLPTTNLSSSKPIVLTVSSMDSASFFHDKGPLLGRNVVNCVVA